MSKRSLLYNSCLRHWGESFFFGEKELTAMVKIPDKSGSLGGIDIDYEVPYLLMKAADAVGIVKNSELTVRGEAYVAASKPKSDGGEFVRIELAEAQDTQEGTTWR